MDLVWYRRYRSGGGEQGFWAWETGEAIATWDHASAPGKAGRKVAEALLRHPLPDRWARPMTNAVHWFTGTGWGLLAPRLGPAVGPLAWATSYVVLPLAGVYKPIWKYDAKTLADDFRAHLAYGATAAAVTRRMSSPSASC
jgi:hypothetical protein